MKKTILTRILLLVLFVATVLTAVSCAKKPDDSSEETTEAGTQAGEEYPYEIVKFGSNGQPMRFNMIARTERSDYLWSEQDGTLMHDSVFARNALLEEQFNIEITLFEGGHSEGNEFAGNIRADINSGEGAYDLVCPQWAWNINTNGYYMNLLSYENELCLDEDWWFHSWNENATFQDALFMVNGDAQFDLYYNLECVYFNKTIAAAIGFSPYVYVDNMTWTVEVLSQFAEMAKIDVNSDGKYDPADGDTIGSLFNQSMINPAMYSFGAKYSTVEDGEVTFHLTREQNITAFEALYKLFNEVQWNYFANTSTLGVGAYQAFNDGNALFCWQALRVAPTIKSSGVVFGMVPTPMVDETQGEYVTTSYDATFFSMLKTAKHKRESAIILNAMNALSYNIIAKTYFEDVLQWRYSDDPDTARMIPIIRNALYYDCSWVNYPFLDGISDKTYSLITSKNKGFTTYYAGYSDNLKTMLTKMNKNYAKYGVENFDYPDLE